VTRPSRCCPIPVRGAPRMSRCSLGRGGPGPCGVVVRARARRLRAGPPPPPPSPPLHPTTLSHLLTLTEQFGHPSRMDSDDQPRCDARSEGTETTASSSTAALAVSATGDSESDRGVTRIEA
jgi:hypothetical protein